MKWLKGDLDLESDMREYVDPCLYSRSCQLWIFFFQGTCLRAHPNKRHEWLLQCTKLRPPLNSISDVWRCELHCAVKKNFAVHVTYTQVIHNEVQGDPTKVSQDSHLNWWADTCAFFGWAFHFFQKRNFRSKMSDHDDVWSQIRGSQLRKRRWCMCTAMVCGHSAMCCLKWVKRIEVIGVLRWISVNEREWAWMIKDHFQ